MSSNLCEWCLMGSSCADNGTHSDSNNNITHSNSNSNITHSDSGNNNQSVSPASAYCICQPGYVNDEIFFHDPNCSMPANAITIWFIIHTVFTTIFVILLLGNQVGKYFALSPYLRRRARRERKRPEVRESPRTSTSSFSATTTGIKSAKNRLLVLTLLGLISGWLIPLALFVEGRAGRFANFAAMSKGIMSVVWARATALYVIKPLFRPLGRKRFDYMRQVLNRLFFGLLLCFVVSACVLIVVNHPDDLQAGHEVERIVYNQCAAIVFLLIMSWGIVCEITLSYHISRLAQKIESTMSFMQGDIFMVTNYARLLYVRRQICLYSLNLLLATPWLIFQWATGTAPFFWVFYMIAFTLCPNYLAWVQLALTRNATISNEQSPFENAEVRDIEADVDNVEGHTSLLSSSQENNVEMIPS